MNDTADIIARLEALFWSVHDKNGLAAHAHEFALSPTLHDEFGASHYRGLPIVRDADLASDEATIRECRT